MSAWPVWRTSGPEGAQNQHAREEEREHSRKWEYTVGTHVHVSIEEHAASSPSNTQFHQIINPSHRISISIELYQDLLTKGRNMSLIRLDTNIKAAVSAWFRGDRLTYGHISEWDVSRVTSMSDLFCASSAWCSYHNSGAEYFNDDISKWDVSSVTNMEGELALPHSASPPPPVPSWPSVPPAPHAARTHTRPTRSHSPRRTARTREVPGDAVGRSSRGGTPGACVCVRVCGDGGYVPVRRQRCSLTPPRSTSRWRGGM